MTHHHFATAHQHAQPHHPWGADFAQNREATKILMVSMVLLLVTAGFQAVVVALSGSNGLLADTIHNFADATTSVPVWIAFQLSRRGVTKRFAYGFGRTEDLAGLIVVLIIFASAVLAGYESITRIIRPVDPGHLSAVAIGAVMGFVGNEVAAIFRIRMGKKVGSAALIADGRHAQVDGWSSLMVLIGVVGTWLGYPVVDSLVGLAITIMILFVVKDAAKSVLTRLLDGMEPEIRDSIRNCASSVCGMCQVTDVRARWVGHEIYAELFVILGGNLSISRGHEITTSAANELRHRIPHLAAVSIHVGPRENAVPFHQFYRPSRPIEGEQSGLASPIVSVPVSWCERKGTT